MLCIRTFVIYQIVDFVRFLHSTNVVRVHTNTLQNAFEFFYKRPFVECTKRTKSTIFTNYKRS